MFELADHLLEVGQDFVVHLAHPGVPVGLGLGYQREGPAAMLAELGQELRPGHEHRAGQAGVGVGQLFCTGRPQ